MKKIKKVYLFACIEKNIGDDLFIYIVCKRYPNITFVISDTASYMKKNDISNLKYSKLLKYWLKASNNNSNNRFLRKLANFMMNVLGFFLPRLNSIYIVGNAFKNLNYTGNNQLYWLSNRLIISKKFYLISTNFGPFNDERWIMDCASIFNQMTDVCFRDYNSYNLFKKLSNVRFAPDAVLSLNNQSIINIRNKNTKIKNNIIISTIDCSLEGRAKELKNAKNLYEKRMIELINYFNNNKISVTLLNSNTSQDFAASQRIYNNCKDKEKIQIYNYEGNIEQLLKLYENSCAVIATRLHTIVLGWLYNIPVIPIVYDIKVKNMLESYNFNSFYKNIDDLMDFNCNDVMKYIDNYSFKITKKILNDSNKQFEKIDQLLNIYF